MCPSAMNEPCRSAEASDSTQALASTFSALIQELSWNLEVGCGEYVGEQGST